MMREQTQHLPSQSRGHSLIIDGKSRDGHCQAERPYVSERIPLRRQNWIEQPQASFRQLASSGFQSSRYSRNSLGTVPRILERYRAKLHMPTQRAAVMCLAKNAIGSQEYWACPAASVQIDDIGATKGAPDLPAIRNAWSHRRAELHPNTHIRISVRNRDKCLLPFPQPRRRAERGFRWRVQVDDVHTRQTVRPRRVPAAWAAWLRRRTELDANAHIRVST